MTSVVIAAHNEESVIGRCLDRLLADAEPGEFEVVVVANGCDDNTAAVAATRGVHVLDLPEGNKSRALNAGDKIATRYPRVYLDADMAPTASDLRALRDALEAPTDPRGMALAAVPSRTLDLRGRPLLVRGYYAINSRLPVFRDGLVGRGMIALSEGGRARFDCFPDVIADDLYLDAIFEQPEKRHLQTVTVEVATPRHTRNLVRRLVRVRRGNTALRNASRMGDVNASVRPSARWSWFIDVVISRPALLPAAAAYTVITIWADLLARRPARREDSWGQDRSTRERLPEPGMVPGGV